MSDTLKAFAMQILFVSSDVLVFRDQDELRWVLNECEKKNRFGLIGISITCNSQLIQNGRGHLAENGELINDFLLEIIPGSQDTTLFNAVKESLQKGSRFLRRNATIFEGPPARNPRVESEIFYANGKENAAGEIAAFLEPLIGKVTVKKWPGGSWDYDVIVVVGSKAASPIPASSTTAIAEPKDKLEPQKQPDAASKSEDEIPRFCQYPATVKFTGKQAPVDFKSDPDSRRFKTRLKEGAKAGPNFAGSFTVVDWGCGTACQSWVIIDARNGRIFSPDFVLRDGTWYRLDSRLVVVDPIDADTQGNVEMIDTKFMIWDGVKLKEIGRTKKALRRSDLERCP